MASEQTAVESVGVPTRVGGRVLGWLWWGGRFAAALFLFVGALQLMKTGAARLDVFEPGGFFVANAASTLGLGWLGALFVLSGSPIAATSLTLVAARESAEVGAAGLSEIQGFTMLSGSRLGAAFVVLVTAVVYALRGGKGNRRAPLSTAVICLSATAIVYVPSAVFGLVLLNWGQFHALELSFGGGFADLIDFIYGDLLAQVGGLSPALIFLAGLGVLLLSFRMIDTVLPTLGDSSVEGSRAVWLTRKWPMFLLGSGVALVTMSVSVALTLLVPLVAKGYVRRRYIIPYVMGANITTLGDTMLAAFALNSPAAVRIVVAEIIVTTSLSVLLLAFAYPQLRSLMGHVERAFVTTPARLVAFTLALFIVPVATIAVAGTIR